MNPAMFNLGAVVQRDRATRARPAVPSPVFRGIGPVMASMGGVGASPQRQLRMGGFAPIFNGFEGTSFGGALGGVVSPQAILDRATQVNTAVQGLVGDMATPLQLDSNLVTQFQAFVDEWNKFYAGLGGIGGWLERLWGSTMDQVEAYATQVSAWRTKLASSGVGITSPDVPTGPASILTLIPTALKWGAVIAALYFGAKLLGVFEAQSHASAAPAAPAHGFGRYRSRRLARRRRRR